MYAPSLHIYTAIVYFWVSLMCFFPEFFLFSIFCYPKKKIQFFTNFSVLQYLPKHFYFFYAPHFIWLHLKQHKANEKRKKMKKNLLLNQRDFLFPFYVFLFHIKLPSDDFIWFIFSRCCYFVPNETFPYPQTEEEKKNWNSLQISFDAFYRTTFNNVSMLFNYTSWCCLHRVVELGKNWNWHVAVFGRKMSFIDGFMDKVLSKTWQNYWKYACQSLKKHLKLSRRDTGKISTFLISNTMRKWCKTIQQNFPKLCKLMSIYKEK